MVTEISPVLMDSIMEASYVVAGAIAVSIGVNIWLSLKYQKKQAKTDAARLALEMQKRFTEQDFRNTIHYLKTDKAPSKWDKNREIQKILNYFEYMGQFEKEGVLKWDYIKNMHGHALKILKNHEDSKKIIEECTKDSKSYFVYIQRMFDKLKID